MPTPVFFSARRNEEERNKQVKRPIYKSHVSSWFGPLRAAIPDALERSRVHAPMLAVLGYTQPAATSSPKVAERVMGNSGEEEVFDKRYSQLERNYLVKLTVQVNFTYTPYELLSIVCTRSQYIQKLFTF